jgi:hypothetical protein
MALLDVSAGEGIMITDARFLARLLTLAALACLLAVSLWPEPVCRACGSEILRDHFTNGGRR